MIPVNLAVDRMASESARTIDVITAMDASATIYKTAATKIGLSPTDYRELERDLNDGLETYGVLPRHIDAMAGVHRRTGRVYALHNVEVPAQTMGWRVRLSDGVVVLIPQRCGNLSMNRAPAKHAPAKHAPRFANTPAYGYHAPTQVTFAAPVTPEVPALTAAPLGPAAIVPAPVAGKSALGFLGLLFPVIGSLLHGGNGGNGGPAFTPPATPIVAPCSAGSNEIGVCAK